MKVYLVWECIAYEDTKVVKVFLKEDKAKEFLKTLSGSMTTYYIEEMEVSE